MGYYENEDHYDQGVEAVLEHEVRKNTFAKQCFKRIDRER